MKGKYIHHLTFRIENCYHTGQAYTEVTIDSDSQILTSEQLEKARKQAIDIASKRIKNPFAILAAYVVTTNE